MVSSTHTFYACYDYNYTRWISDVFFFTSFLILLTFNFIPFHWSAYVLAVKSLTSAIKVPYTSLLRWLEVFLTKNVSNIPIPIRALKISIALLQRTSYSF